MKAPRSLGSTTAPHLIILPTSLVHVSLPRRCCRMMRGSWHSRQAVRTLACTGPGGKSGDCAQESGTAASQNNAIVNPLRLNPSGLNTDFHLVNGVIEISAGIPCRGRRLSAALAVARALIVYSPGFGALQTKLHSFHA